MKKAVNDVIADYKRGGKRDKVAIYEPSTQRWVIKLPKRLQTAMHIDHKDKITAYTEREVYQKAYELLCDHSVTLRDIYELAMEDRDKDLTITDVTQRRMRIDWNRHYEHSALADRPITEIKASELERFLKNNVVACRLTRNGYTNMKCILNLIYDYAVANDIVGTNVARQIHLHGVKFEPTGQGTYTTEQRSIVMDYIERNRKWDDSIYYAAIYLMFNMCCRVGEVKALHWSDYNPEKGTILIHREVVTRNGRQVELEHTKNPENGNRDQYLSSKAIEMLEHLRKTSTSDLIFPSAEGHYLTTKKFNEKLAFIASHTGIPYMSSHKIRFWSVTAIARASGGDITATGKYAGQSCTQTTLHYIRYAQDEDVQRAAARAVMGP